MLSKVQIDHRDLLRKFMSLVAVSEDMSYVSAAELPTGDKAVYFSKAEIEELKQISKEVLAF